MSKEGWPCEGLGNQMANVDGRKFSPVLEEKGILNERKKKKWKINEEIKKTLTAKSRIKIYVLAS